MAQLNRRRVLAGAAALAVAPAITTGVRAAAPKAGKQAPGFYRYKLGDFEITVVNDGIWLRKLEAGTVPNAPLADVQRALSEAFQPNDVVQIPFSPIVVNTGAKLVMLDTSVGGRFVPTSGTHMENFLAAGLDPNAVDLIVISHFHPDHINGIWTKDDKIAFPNAEIAVPAQEWAYWMDEARQGNPPEPLKGLFANCKRVFGPIASKVTRYEPGKEVAPGITSLATFGHTLGHTGFIIASGGQTLLHLQDSVGNPALFARYPEWHYAADMDKPLAVETRKKLLDRAAADKMRIQAMHFPFPGTGYIVREGTGYRFQPAAWSHML
jgi:glyoxylase-like metal-dependent hydrolase (beta-lactamase superfamily II)